MDSDRAQLLRARLEQVLSAKEVASILCDLRDLQQNTAQVDPGTGEPNRQPTRYEQYLMTLLQFDTVEELTAFLNGPSHPGFLEQSQVPEQAYELLKKERLAEEDEWQRTSIQVMRPEKQLSLPNWTWLAVCTALVCVGFSKLPYSYYMLLRLVICLTAVGILVKLIDRHLNGSWMWVYGVVAFWYNPILPVHLYDKEAWEFLNVATVILFWIGWWRLRSRLYSRSVS